MKTVVVTLLVCVGAVTGCTVKPFQPLPPKFLQWTKQGRSTQDVKDQLVACGYDNPYGGFSSTKNPTWDQIISVELCMERNGFKYLLSDRKSVCDLTFSSTQAACKGASSSPERAVMGDAARAATGQPVTSQNCYGRSRDPSCAEFWQDTGGVPVLRPATSTTQGQEETK